MNYSDIIKKLDQTNREKVKGLFDEIETEFQIKGQPDIVIDFLPSNCRPRPSKEKITEEYTKFEGGEIKKRLGALNFLKKHKVVMNYNVDSFHHRQDGNTQYHIEIKLDNDNFTKFKTSIKRLADRSVAANSTRGKPALVKKNQSEVLYQVEFTKNNEIFINEFLLQKPHSGNENAKVFRHLFENPNQNITKSDLQEKVGSVGKELRKIVENLGFTGNYLKVFFQISKDNSILFRNPITSNDLQDLKIPHLSLKIK